MSDTQHNLQISEILICGRVSLLSMKSLEQLARNYGVLVAGRGDLQSRSSRIHVYDIDPQDEKFVQLFDAWQIDAVIYISGYADGGSGENNELMSFDKLVSCCRNSVVSKLIILSSIESLNFQARYGVTGNILSREYASGRAFAAVQFEETVQYYARNINQKTILLRVPYIVSDMQNGNFISDVFDAISNGAPVVFPYRMENKIDIISGEDLTALLLNVLEEDMDTSASYNVSSGYHYTWGDLENKLKDMIPEIIVRYQNGLNYISIQNYPIDLKRKYGFVPLDNVLELLPDYYEAYREKRAKKEKGLKSFLKKGINFVGKRLIGYIELIVLFILVQYLMKAAGQSVYFKYVDLRLFYVLLLGSVHGMQIGFLAGVLEGISLYLDYRSMGITGTMLFYNIENWLPFVIYLMSGSVTGYMRSLYLKKIQFQKEENDILRDRYLFLNDVYHGAIENKSEYRRQILGYQDSFGTIYEAVSRLNSDEPGKIFMNGIKVLENILKNHSIAVYTVEKEQNFARLAVCSGDIFSRLGKSLNLKEMPEVVNTLKAGEIFRNTQLVSGIPMYAAGIMEQDSLTLIIAVYEAGPDQMSLYYLNLFNILCGLIRLSFLRALQYQNAIEMEKYYPDTLILRPEYFEEVLRQQQILEQNAMSGFVMIRFENRNLQEVNQQLRGMIRSRDVLGCDDGGSIYLLLLQMTEDHMHIIRERLEKKEIAYTLVPGGKI